MTAPEIITALFAQHASAWHVAQTDTQRARVVECAAKALEPILRDAVNASCSCGGKPLGDGCCPACEVWHRLTRPAQISIPHQTHA